MAQANRRFLSFKPKTVRRSVLSRQRVFCRCLLSVETQVATRRQRQDAFEPRAAFDAGMSVPAFLRIDNAAPQATTIELRLPTGISILVPLAAIDSLSGIIAHLTIQQSQAG